MVCSLGKVCVTLSLQNSHDASGRSCPSMGSRSGTSTPGDRDGNVLPPPIRGFLISKNLLCPWPAAALLTGSRSGRPTTGDREGIPSLINKHPWCPAPQLPFDGLQEWKIYSAVVNHGERPRLDRFESFLAAPGAPEAERQAITRYSALMQRCWASAPAERPRFKEVCSSVDFFCLWHACSYTKEAYVSQKVSLACLYPASAVYKPHSW